MKTNVYGFLAASILGLTFAPAYANEAAKVEKAVFGSNIVPRVEVVALDRASADRLLTERKKHFEELEKLNEEHKRTIDDILATASR